MSRRAAPDSPWQNGMPPFGLCQQQQFNPMMNCGPMWAQPSLPFMGGSMAPDMMRFGGNVSSRSNFRRNYDQPDRYSRPRQPYGDRSGNRPISYGGRGADRKRPAPGHRSRSPAAKKAKRLDGGRKPEQGKPKGAEGAGEEEEQDGAGPSAELYDPAEPTSEDAGDGVEQAEGNEDDESGAAQQDETADGGDEEGDAENDESAPQDESGDTRPARNGTFDQRWTGSHRGVEFMTDSAIWGPRKYRHVWERPTSRHLVTSRAFPDSRRHDERNTIWGPRRHRHVWEHTTARHLGTSGAFPDSRRHERNAPSASTSTMMLEGRRGRFSIYRPPQQQQQQWHFDRTYHRSCSQAEGKPGPSKPAGKPGAKSGGGAAKASESKSSGGRPGDKKDSAARSDKEQGAKRGGPRGKGWCTVCELHFEGNFLDHRRTEEHKTKRDEKYPKCHPCSMGFNNRVQYEQHCAGDFHRKNVEVLDNEVDETAGPLGEEYLEEVPAFFCTLCKILLKADLKKQHCCTQGHYRRHRDVKRKEEAALKAKLAKEKQADDEDEDVSQMAFTVTDEILSDDEAKAASEATAGESSKQVKVEEPAEVPPEDLPQQQQDGEPETPMEEVPGADPKAEEEQPEEEQPEEEQPEPEVQVKAEQVKAEPEEGMENKELHEMKAEEEAAATAMDDSDEVAIPDTNGCKSMEEEGDEQQQQAPQATPAPKTAARPPSATAKTAPAPKALKAPAKPNLAPAKVPHKSVLAAKAAATPKPLAKPMSVTPKPAVAAPKPATRIPAAKAAGTAASTAAVTSAPAATAAAAPGKKPAAGAAASEPSAAAGVGGMAGGRGRGTQKAVRGVGTRKR